jgi:hypothetical protein
MAKAKRRPPSLDSDIGPAERSQHRGGLELEPVARDLRGNPTALRAKAKVECILDAYWRRCQIVDRQHEAGLVFRTYWHRAQGAPRVTTRYDLSPRFRGAATDAVSVARSDAQRRLENALGALSAAQRTVVVAVCGMDEWAGGTDRLDTLRRGLTALADLWRIEMKPERR